MNSWNKAIFLTINLALTSTCLVAADPTRAKTLTVDEATELLKTPNSLRVGATELSPEAAAVLATFKGELRFEALTTLSPETASRAWSCSSSWSESSGRISSSTTSTTSGLV
ncbi:MAG: hypothetical protein FJY37_10650 [Betaproteobacteria bacterium]|nr:hypothetical protein [Betaproteobacteria bacterium]